MFENGIEEEIMIGMPPLFFFYEVNFHTHYCKYQENCL